MDKERLSAFINAFDTDRDPKLASLEKRSVSGGIPIIRHEMISFLQVILEIQKPGRILEVGTATGFSALVMASFAPDTCQITTIEKDEERIAAARKNFSEFQVRDRICLIPGDARDILERLSEASGSVRAYDLVFMDAAKAQYIHFLPFIKKLLAPGGLLVSDNVLQEGTIAESRYALDRRERTIHSRMREYLYVLTHTEGLKTSVTPCGDGTALTVKTEQWTEPIQR